MSEFTEYVTIKIETYNGFMDKIVSLKEEVAFKEEYINFAMKLFLASDGIIEDDVMQDLVTKAGYTLSLTDDDGFGDIKTVLVGKGQQKLVLRPKSSTD